MTKDDLLYWGWTVIANAGGGDWDSEAPEWKKAATDWRDAFHAMLDAGEVEKPRERDTVPDPYPLLTELLRRRAMPDGET